MSTSESLAAVSAAPLSPLRFRVFIDFWNLQLALNDREADATGKPDAPFYIDWLKLPETLVAKAADLVHASRRQQMS